MFKRSLLVLLLTVPAVSCGDPDNYSDLTVFPDPVNPYIKFECRKPGVVAIGKAYFDDFILLQQEIPVCQVIGAG